MVEDQPSVRGGLPILSLTIFTNFQKEINLQFSSMGHSSLFVGRYKWTVTDVAPCVQHAFRLWLHGKVSLMPGKEDTSISTCLSGRWTGCLRVPISSSQGIQLRTRSSTIHPQKTGPVEGGGDRRGQRGGVVGGFPMCGHVRRDLREALRSRRELFPAS